VRSSKWRGVETTRRRHVAEGAGARLGSGGAGKTVPAGGARTP
jgi:hypothetical protein